MYVQGISPSPFAFQFSDEKSFLIPKYCKVEGVDVNNYTGRNITIKTGEILKIMTLHGGRVQYLSPKLRVMSEKRLSSQDTALLVKRQRPIHAREIRGVGQGDGGKSRGGSVVDVRSKCAFGAEGA